MPVGSELDTPLAGRKKASSLASQLRHWSADGVEVAPSTFARIVWSSVEYADHCGGEMAEDRQVLMGVLAGTTAAAALQHLLD